MHYIKDSRLTTRRILDNIEKDSVTSTTRERMRLSWSEQMLRVSDEGTVLNSGTTVAKDFDVQENVKLKILRFWSRYRLLFLQESSL